MSVWRQRGSACHARSASLPVGRRRSSVRSSAPERRGRRQPGESPQATHTAPAKFVARAVKATGIESGDRSWRTTLQQRMRDLPCLNQRPKSKPIPLPCRSATENRRLVPRIRKGRPTGSKNYWVVLGARPEGVRRASGRPCRCLPRSEKAGAGAGAHRCPSLVPDRIE
jgi:hypothetical protein